MAVISTDFPFIASYHERQKQVDTCLPYIQNTSGILQYWFILQPYILYQIPFRFDDMNTTVNPQLFAGGKVCRSLFEAQYEPRKVKQLTQDSYICTRVIPALFELQIVCFLLNRSALVYRLLKVLDPSKLHLTKIHTF